MTPEHAHRLFEYREFARASAGLVLALSRDGDADSNELVPVVMEALLRLPEEALDDDEVIGALDRLAELPLLFESRASLMLALGFAHARRYEATRAREDIERAVHLSGMLLHASEQSGNQRLGAWAQVLVGDTKRLSEEPWAAAWMYRQAHALLLSLDDKVAANAMVGRLQALKSVRFTTYYPRTVVSSQRYVALAYAHLLELQDDVSNDVRRFASDLGDHVPRPREARGLVGLKKNTAVTVVPECLALDFDPPALTKKWDGTWTRFAFDFRPNQDLVGEVVVFRFSIQVAGIEVAAIENCAIEVLEADTSASEAPDEVDWSDQTSGLYQTIFISYSRKDQEITEQYKLAQLALGNEAFLDVDDLRTGQSWKWALENAIANADVFQLFWSPNSAASQYCKFEWQRALSVRPPSERGGFIRPVYWHKPMPEPPPELSHIHFKYVPLGSASP